MHPLLSHSPLHSIPRSKRFPGTKNGTGELDLLEAQRRSTPGPGAYFKSQPGVTAFSADGGETVVLGANHACPWKKCLGHNINPVHVDLSLMSAPCFSFTKTRRTMSETFLVNHGQDCGPIKSDLGCLSPGPVYETHGTMRPAVGQPASTIRRRARSTTSLPRVRVEPAPPEVDVPQD